MRITQASVEEACASFLRQTGKQPKKVLMNPLDLLNYNTVAFAEGRAKVVQDTNVIRRQWTGVGVVQLKPSIRVPPGELIVT